MRRVLYLLGFVLVGLMFVAGPASANSACVAGNFSSVDGTTCDIGTLQFTFTGTSSFGGGWTASNLFFTPTADGFTFTFLGGPQSLTESNPYPYLDDVVDELSVNYNVVALQGFLSGVGVSSNATFGASGFSSFATNGLISSPPAGEAGFAASCGVQLGELPPPPPVCGLANLGGPAANPHQTTASGNAFVFDLIAANGTAFWSGSPTTFSFSTENTVPEPSSVLMLGIGLICTALLSLKRRLGRFE
jgi:PEP-CTERM motif